MRTVRLLGITMLLGSSLAACGGGGGGGTPAGGEAAPVSGQVGQLAGNLLEQVEVSGSETTNERKSLVVGDTIATDADGRVDFALDRKKTRCKVNASTKLAVHPSDDVIVAWETGSSECSTDGRDNETFVGALYCTPHSCLQLSDDPVFGIVVEDGASTIKMVRGLGLVAGVAGDPVVLGPGQQAVTETDGATGAPTPLEAAPEEQAAYDELIAGLPEPVFSLPQPGETPDVDNVLQQGIVSVALAESARDQPSVEQFVRGMFGALAARWGLEFELVFVTEAEAAADIEEERSVFPFLIVRQTDETSAPLLIDETGQRWDLFGWLELSEEFNEFLTNFLEQGDYGELYAASFGSPPPYDLFISLTN